MQAHRSLPPMPTSPAPNSTSDRVGADLRRTAVHHRPHAGRVCHRARSSAPAVAIHLGWPSQPRAGPSSHADVPPEHSLVPRQLATHGSARLRRRLGPHSWHPALITAAAAAPATRTASVRDLALEEHPRQGRRLAPRDTVRSPIPAARVEQDQPAHRGRAVAPRRRRFAALALAWRDSGTEIAGQSTRPGGTPTELLSAADESHGRARALGYHDDLWRQRGPHARAGQCRRIVVDDMNMAEVDQWCGKAQRASPLTGSAEIDRRRDARRSRYVAEQADHRRCDDAYGVPVTVGALPPGLSRIHAGCGAREALPKANVPAGSLHLRRGRPQV